MEKLLSAESGVNFHKPTTQPKSHSLESFEFGSEEIVIFLQSL
jgi:hypothetical protein